MKIIKTTFITFVLMSFFILIKVNASTLSINSASYTNNGTSWSSLSYWSADNRYDFNPYLMQAIRLNLNLTSCSTGGQYNFTFYTDPSYSNQGNMIDSTTLNGISCNVSVTQTGNAYVSCPNVPSSSNYELQFRPYTLPQSFTMGIVKEYSFTCGFDSNSIINNNNSNTNNIINNNNNNTQEIINNNNNNTQDIINNNNENFNNCNNSKNLFIPTKNYIIGGFNGNNGNFSSIDIQDYEVTMDSITIQDNTDWKGYISGAYYLKTNTNYTISFTASIDRYFAGVAFYRQDGSYISNINVTGQRTFTVPTDTVITRFIFEERNGTRITYSNIQLEEGSKTQYQPPCTNRLDDNTQAINDVNSSINNNNVSGANQDANNFVNNPAFQDNTGLSSIITAPLTVVNSLTDTCNPIRLNLPYINTNIDIPCIGDLLSSKMGVLIQLVKVVINGYICYLVGLDMFNIVKHARDPNDDRIEVLDL